MPGPFENRLDNPAIRRRRKLAEAKANRERAFSSPPSRTVNDVVNPVSVEGAASIAGAYASRGLQKGIASNIGQALLGPVAGPVAKFLVPENNKPIRDMTTRERKAEAYNALELSPIVGDAAAIARSMEDINREGVSPRTLGRAGIDIGLSIINPVGGAGPIKRGLGIMADNDQSIVDALVEKLSKEARQLGKGPAPKIEETPRNITAFTPSTKDTEGFWESVEKPAIDPISGQAAFDPSEIRSVTFGGVGALAKGTPLESLSDLVLPNKAVTIRAIYKPPTAEEILNMMRKTDASVPSRLKAKRDRLTSQIEAAQKAGDMDSALRLAAELDNTVNPKDWKRNKYSLKDAETLRERWISASKHFEDLYGNPLPWRLEADYLDEAGNIKTARIFGQDVEHKVPVNRGGKGTIDELTLLPTIPNTGKRDYSWDDYAAKYPDEWNSLIEILYGSGTRY